MCETSLLTSLTKYLDSIDQPFEWGKNDCWTLVAGWLRVLGWNWEIDRIEKRLGTYTTSHASLRAEISADLHLCPETIEREARHMLEVRHGIPAVGDVVLMAVDGGLWALGIASTKRNVVWAFPRDGEKLAPFEIGGTNIYYRVVREGDDWIAAVSLHREKEDALAKARLEEMEQV